MEPPDASGDRAKDFEAWVIHTRLAQGLPARVADVAVLARIADLICNHQNERTGAEVSAADATAEEDTVTTEPSHATSGMNPRSQRHQRDRRLVVWGCKEHQAPPGQECQGCIDQGELFTRADAADLARRRPYHHRRRPQ